MLTTKNICAQMETRVFCIPLPQVGLCEGGHVATKRAAEFAECYRDALERSGDDAPSLRGAGAARTSRKVVAYCHTSRASHNIHAPAMQPALSRSRRMPLPISICHGRCEPTHGCGAQVDRLGDHALACPRTGLLARSGSAVERASVLPSSALLDDACVRRFDKQVRQWGRRLLGWPAGAPRAAVLGELGWACFPWKSERPKQACLGVFVQLTRMVPIAVLLLAFSTMLSVFPPPGRIKFGAA